MLLLLVVVVAVKAFAVVVVVAVKVFAVVACCCCCCCHCYCNCWRGRIVIVDAVLSAFMAQQLQMATIKIVEVLWRKLDPAAPNNS